MTSQKGPISSVVSSTRLIMWCVLLGICMLGLIGGLIAWGANKMATNGDSGTSTPRPATREDIRLLLRGQIVTAAIEEPDSVRGAIVSFEHSIAAEVALDFVARYGMQVERIYFALPPRGSGQINIQAGEDMREELLKAGSDVLVAIDAMLPSDREECRLGDENYCTRVRRSEEAKTAFVGEMPPVTALGVRAHPATLRDAWDSGQSIYAVKLTDELSGVPLFPDTEINVWF